MSGFGRKGLAGAAPQSFGAAMAQRHAVASPVPAAVSEPTPSSELAAFLAAERTRKGPAIEPGLTDVAIATPRARSTAGGGGDKSMLLAYVLWWFACSIGAHRFYLGATGSALAMLGLFAGSFVIMFIMPPIGLMMLVGWLLWVIGDAFLIPGLVRAANRPDGAVIFA
jgi:TM2 domain-containing membrane protein YozV